MLQELFLLIFVDAKRAVVSMTVRSPIRINGDIPIFGGGGGQRRRAGPPLTASGPVSYADAIIYAPALMKAVNGGPSSQLLILHQEKAGPFEFLSIRKIARARLNIERRVSVAIIAVRVFAGRLIHGCGRQEYIRGVLRKKHLHLKYYVKYI